MAIGVLWRTNPRRRLAERVGIAPPRPLDQLGAHLPHIVP